MNQSDNNNCSTRKMKQFYRGSKLRSGRDPTFCSSSGTLSTFRLTSRLLQDHSKRIRISRIAKLSIRKGNGDGPIEKTYISRTVWSKTFMKSIAGAGRRFAGMLSWGSGPSGAELRWRPSEWRELCLDGMWGAQRLRRSRRPDGRRELRGEGRRGGKRPVLEMVAMAGGGG